MQPTVTKFALSLSPSSSILSSSLFLPSPVSTSTSTPRTTSMSISSLSSLPSGFEESIVLVPTSAVDSSDSLLPTGSSSVQSDSPLMAFVPSFAESMPVQLLMNGLTMTLLGILCVHLLFTMRYHAPLSKLNYGLQVSAVVVTGISVSTSLALIFQKLKTRQHEWPFMFDYIEIDIPPTDKKGRNIWNGVQLTIWETLQALVVLAVHSAHIQLLTMLFPSALEVRLIFSLLSPLALAASALCFTHLSDSQSVIDLGDAIRNICNSTLTLLYTCGLVIWGVYLNRSRAWRSGDADFGTTAAFGSLALSLAIVGAIVNFIEVGDDELSWLGNVVWCILLWQSWVAWWWFVGSGLWSGEAEKMAKKQRVADKKRKREQRKAERDETWAHSSSIRTLTSQLARRGVPRSPTGTSTAPSSSDSAGSDESNHPVFSLLKPIAKWRAIHDAAVARRHKSQTAQPKAWGITALISRGARRDQRSDDDEDSWEDLPPETHNNSYRRGPKDLESHGSSTSIPAWAWLEKWRFRDITVFDR